jgi:hypothetical protein
VAVVGVSARPARYVVLCHEAVAQPHYDFMIELSEGGDLPTWRAPRWPPSTGDYFVRLPDHRNAYLEYEGPVSGGRGTVRRVAAGACEARLGDGVLSVAFPDGRELTAVKDSPEQWHCIVA